MLIPRDPADASHQTTTADLSARLSRLEARLASARPRTRPTAIPAAALVAIAGAFLAGAAASPTDVQHRSLDIVGPDGQIAATLRGHGDGGGILILYGPDGTAHVTLSAQRGGRLILSGRVGDELVILGELAPLDQGALLIRNTAGEVAVQITSDQLGRGYVGVFDPRGVGRTLQPRPSDGLGSRWQPSP